MLLAATSFTISFGRCRKRIYQTVSTVARISHLDHHHRRRREALQALRGCDDGSTFNDDPHFVLPMFRRSLGISCRCAQNITWFSWQGTLSLPFPNHCPTACLLYRLFFSAFCTLFASFILLPQISLSEHDPTQSQQHNTPQMSRHCGSHDIDHELPLVKSHGRKNPRANDCASPSIVLLADSCTPLIGRLLQRISTDNALPLRSLLGMSSCTRAADSLSGRVVVAL